MTAVEAIRRQAGSLASEAARGVLVQLAGRLTTGSLRVEFYDGTVRHFGRPSAQPAADIKILQPTLYRRLVLGGEIAFGEAYVDGLWQSSDLVALLSLGIMNRPRVNLNVPGLREPRPG